MKKKFLAILTIAAMTLSFTACGDSDKKTTEEKTTTESTSGGQDLQHSIELDGNILTPDENDGIDITATRGTVENNAFTNETFKVSFPITENMTVVSDKDALSVIGADSSILESDGTYTAEKIESATGNIYDSIIYLSENGSNVIIFYTSLLGLGGSYTAEQYAEITAKQFPAPTYTVDPITSATYGGKTYSVLSIKNNDGYSQKMLMRKENGYMVCITLTLVAGDEALGEDFLNSLTEVQ